MDTPEHCTVHGNAWMNRYEIEDAHRVAKQYCHIFSDEDAQLRMLAAATFLFDYMHVIDSCSDGWSTWAGGTRPAAPLSMIVSHIRDPQASHQVGACQCVTRKQIEKAMRRIELFCAKRNLQTPQRLPLASMPPPRAIHTPTPVIAREPQGLTLFDLAS